MSAADSQDVAAAAPAVENSSPTKASRSKAAEGAALALQASQNAAALLTKTQQAITAAGLHDGSLPLTPVSPSGLEGEHAKAADASSVAPSSWYRGNTTQVPMVAGCPAENDPKFAELLSAGLRGVSLNQTPMSLDDAKALAALLPGASSRITTLDLSKALVLENAPPIPEKVLQALTDDLADEIGPESDEDNVAKLQGMLEKIKVDYNGYEAGIEALARKQLDRYRMLFSALEANTTLEEINLSFNNLGAPNGEGRSTFALLRKLAKVIDGNTTLARLDLRGNRFGPVGAGLVAKAMCKNISIHTLDLGGCDLTGEGGDEDDDPDQEEEDPVFGELMQGLEALSEVFKKNKFLRCLCLRGNRIKGEIDEAGEDDGMDTPFGKLIEPLKKFHRLNILDLSGNELEAGGARMLADVLAQNHSIQVLDVSDNNLGPKGLKHLARLVRESKSLHTLIARQNGMVGKAKTKRQKREALEAATEFGAALGESQLLTTLDLSGNHFGPEVSAAILKGLATSSITKLSFAMNDICAAHLGDYDDVALAHIVSSFGQCPLKELDLSGNFLQAQGLALLFTPASEEDNAKSPVHGVSTLDLSRNGVDDEGAKFVWSFIAREDLVLRELNLSFNSLTDAAAVALAVQMNTSLHNLDLSHNLFGKGSVEAFRKFIDGIVDRPGLHKLNLAGNQLHDEHASAISYLCRTALAPFVAADFSDNPNISISAVEKIVIALKNNRSITHVSISSQAGDRTELGRALVDTLTENQTLVDVDFAFPPGELEEADVNKVRDALLFNSIRK